MAKFSEELLYPVYLSQPQACLDLGLLVLQNPCDLDVIYIFFFNLYTYVHPWHCGWISACHFLWFPVWTKSRPQTPWQFGADDLSANSTSPKPQSCEGVFGKSTLWCPFCARRNTTSPRNPWSWCNAATRSRAALMKWEGPTTFAYLVVIRCRSTCQTTFGSLSCLGRM